MESEEVIYLDNNATTPIDKRVLEAMMPYFTNNFANASSTHAFGLSANEAVKDARKQVADLIGSEPYEIVFTSGATESINLAMKGVAESYSAKGKHIVTVSTEHSAVLDTCRYLERKGYEITYLPVNEEGLINPKQLTEVLRGDTILVCVMYVNNETGVIQPIKEIAQIAHDKGILFMSDATQAVGKIPIDVNRDGIDLLCMSGHKIYAPKGVGALYVRQQESKMNLPALLHGGGHERGYRSGTLNVPGIVGLGAACAIAKKEMKKNQEAIGRLREYLESELLKIEGAKVNGAINQRLYNVTNIKFEGIDSDALIMGLSNKEEGKPIIAISNGSACTAASIEASHVLTAMGLNETDAFSCIRFSLGKYTTKADVAITTTRVVEEIQHLRKMAFF